MSEIYFAKPEDHYRIYESGFVRDLRCGEYKTAFPTIYRPGDYKDEPVIRFAPSQNSDLTGKERRALTKEWIAFLGENVLPGRERSDRSA